MNRALIFFDDKFCDGANVRLARDAFVIVSKYEANKIAAHSKLTRVSRVCGDYVGKFYIFTNKNL